MLGVVVAAAVAPDTGAVPADTQCPYGVCPSTTMDLLPWEITLGVLIAVAVALGLLILLKRRRGGGAAPGPVEEWEGGGPGPHGEETAAAAPMAAAGAPAGAAAAYLETPEDVGVPPPAVPPPAVAPPKAAGGEADIDSLMQELDKISNEILKRGGPKGGKDKGTGGEQSDGGSGDGSS